MVFYCNEKLSTIFKISSTVVWHILSFFPIKNGRQSNDFLNSFSNLHTLNQPKSDCIYHFPMDLEPNGIPFCSKSIGKCYVQSDFGLI